MSSFYQSSFHKQAFWFPNSLMGGSADSQRLAKWVPSLYSLLGCLCVHFLQSGSIQDPAAEAKKSLFLRLVTLPSSRFAYKHILAQLPAIIKKKIIRACSVQQSRKTLRKQICLGRPEVRSSGGSWATEFNWAAAAFPPLPQLLIPLADNRDLPVNWLFLGLSFT
jgi:hypothetical protein